jgi:hypothetical protein
MQRIKTAINTYITSSYNTLYKLLRLKYKSAISKGIILAIFTIIA